MGVDFEGQTRLKSWTSSAEEREVALTVELKKQRSTPSV